MSRDSLNRILSTISSFAMIDDHDAVIVALSGGADSVALLEAIAEIAPRFYLKLSAAHVHHGLRGAEADRDAAFAETITAQIAERHGLAIPFYLHRADVKAVAKELKLSPQQAGRLVRDTYLRRLMAETGATKIATGHTGSDNAETFLMRLVTGAGPEGLSGIPPVHLPYIRPLIEATRREVEALLTARGIGWIVDSSNLKNAYLRNRVRNTVIPALAAVSPSVERSLMEAAASYRDAFDLLSAAADAFLARRTGDDAIAVDELAALDPAVASEVIKLLIFGAAGPRQTPLRLSRTHVRAVLALVGGPSRGTKTVRLPGGLVARRIYDRFSIGHAAPRPAPDAPAPVETPLVIPGVTALPSRGLVATARIVDPAAPGQKNVPETCWPGAAGRTSTTAVFDYDRLPDPPAVRGPRPGDRIALPNGRGTKKLSDLLIDEKVPRDLRAFVPLLVSGADIMWVVGWAVDGRFTPTRETRRVLSVTFEPDET